MVVDKTNKTNQSIKSTVNQKTISDLKQVAHTAHISPSTHLPIHPLPNPDTESSTTPPRRSIPAIPAQRTAHPGARSSPPASAVRLRTPPRLASCAVQSPVARPTERRMVWVGWRCWLEGRTACGEGRMALRRCIVPGGVLAVRWCAGAALGRDWVRAVGWLVGWSGSFGGRGLDGDVVVVVGARSVIGVT
jgi:hypothetical protein